MRGVTLVNGGIAVGRFELRLGAEADAAVTYGKFVEAVPSRAIPSSWLSPVN